jgi:hypothetical protein
LSSSSFVSSSSSRYRPSDSNTAATELADATVRTLARRRDKLYRFVGVDARRRRLVRSSRAPRSRLSDWCSPWLRINLLLRDLRKLDGVREARAVPKVELTRAISMRAAMKTAPGWRNCRGAVGMKRALSYQLPESLNSFISVSI